MKTFDIFVENLVNKKLLHAAFYQLREQWLLTSQWVCEGSSYEIIKIKSDKKK